MSHDQATTHVIPPRIYFTVFAVLILLTAATVAASEVDLGKLNVVVALAIAVTKATLVILYFMHVRYETGLTWLVIVVGFLWLMVLIAFVLSDVLTRTTQVILGG
jgi:cytochrome c oxidase subunit 4